MAMASSSSSLARRVSSLLHSRTSSASTRSSVRRFSADHHGPPKVNFWEDPMTPSKWKEEHFVLISLAGWGLFGYGVFKAFTSGKSKPPAKEEVLEEVALTFKLSPINLIEFTDVQCGF